MSDGTSATAFHIGVDLSGARVLAGVFNPSFQLLGKSKFSPKPERGSAAVLDRIARCIRDSVDECDLTLKEIRGIGIAVPGAVDADAGLVLTARRLELENVPLKSELERRLRLPVVIENDCNAAALAIYAQELDSKPRHFVAVFLERPSPVGMIVEGRFGSEMTHNFPAPIPELVPLLDNPDVRNPAKQLRKAAYSRVAGAEEQIHAFAQRAGEFVAHIMDLLHPDVLALGGGAIEELKEWFVPVILKNVRERVQPEVVDEVELFVSELGKDAGILGGAVLASRSANPGFLTHSIPDSRAFVVASTPAAKPAEREESEH